MGVESHAPCDPTRLQVRGHRLWKHRADRWVLGQGVTAAGTGYTPARVTHIMEPKHCECVLRPPKCVSWMVNVMIYIFCHKKGSRWWPKYFLLVTVSVSISSLFEKGGEMEISICWFTPPGQKQPGLGQTEPGARAAASCLSGCYSAGSLNQALGWSGCPTSHPPTIPVDHTKDRSCG